jgi:hypothetical protein
LTDWSAPNPWLFWSCDDPFTVQGDETQVGWPPYVNPILGRPPVNGTLAELEENACRTMGEQRYVIAVAQGAWNTTDEI